MRRPRSSLWALLSLLAACGGDTPASPTSGGQVVVSITTTGEDIDRDGYLVQLDGARDARVSLNGSVVFNGVTPGEHTVTLLDVQPNCQELDRSGTPPVVETGHPARVTYTIRCAALVPASIGVTPSSVHVPQGSAPTQLTPRVFDENGLEIFDQRTYAFASSDATVASVTQSGTLGYPGKAGTASILVTSDVDTLTSLVRVDVLQVAAQLVVPDTVVVQEFGQAQVQPLVFDLHGDLFLSAQVSYHPDLNPPQLISLVIGFGSGATIHSIGGLGTTAIRVVSEGLSSMITVRIVP